ncbi:MAG: hypothetical protein AAGA23_06355 [Pseudomonadota bacterium]
MNDSLSDVIQISLTAEQIGRLFLGRAHTFELVDTPPGESAFELDNVVVDAPGGRCRLTYSEWEEDAAGGAKVLVCEYAIELRIGDMNAFATYSASIGAEQRGGNQLVEMVKRAAEDDFMLCAKLLGRSVRRDLVIDDEDTPLAGEKFH